MIFNISGRSDIVAFYSDWFFHRLKEGYVYVRNPYYPTQITKYLINEDVIDCARALEKALLLRNNKSNYM